MPPPIVGAWNLQAEIAGLFEKVDLLACPAMPTPTPPIGDDGLPIMAEGYVRPRFTYPFNFSNSPTLTLPCGFTSDALPIALQLVGPHFAEETLLRVGCMRMSSRRSGIPECLLSTWADVGVICRRVAPGAVRHAGALPSS